MMLAKNQPELRRREISTPTTRKLTNLKNQTWKNSFNPKMPYPESNGTVTKSGDRIPDGRISSFPAAAQANRAASPRIRVITGFSPNILEYVLFC